MLRSRRSRRRAYTTVTVTIVACLAAALLAGPANAATTFVSESLPTYESQLHSGDVHAVVFHVRPHEVHASLNGGRKVSAVYPPSQEQALIAAAHSRGVPVKIVKAKPEGFRSHHKLRYIAGGIVIVVIIVVVVVLVLNRRRKRQAEMGMA